MRLGNLYDDLGFLNVTATEPHREKDQNIKMSVGAGIGGIVYLTLVDNKHRLLTRINLEPEQAMEFSHALEASVELVYGTA